VHFPLLVPCALALVYVALLVARFPRLIRWENGDSDIVSAYLLADAVSHGHTGQVVMSTQGSWLPLWYGLLTHGLGFHRVLWEISPALLSLATAVVIGLTVARISSPSRGALATSLVVAVGPIALLNFTAAFHHNTTIPAAALLGWFLVWSTVRPRREWTLVAAVIAVSVIVGICVASDELLVVVGLLPFIAAAALRRLRTGERHGLAPVVAVTVGAAIVAVVVSASMRSLGFSTTTPALHFSFGLIAVHAKWLLQGLLRIGNGLSVSHRRRIPTRAGRRGRRGDRRRNPDPLPLGDHGDAPSRAAKPRARPRAVRHVLGRDAPVRCRRLRPDDCRPRSDRPLPDRRHPGRRGDASARDRQPLERVAGGHRSQRVRDREHRCAAVGQRSQRDLRRSLAVGGVPARQLHRLTRPADRLRGLLGRREPRLGQRWVPERVSGHGPLRPH
jgi:hypothetical protein